MADVFNTGEESLRGSERRAHRRQSVRSLAYVELDQDNGGIVLDASEGGLAVQAAISMIDQPLLKVRLQAPQSKSWIEAGARIVWTGDKRKRAGLQFMELSDGARSQIRQWLLSEGPPIQSHSSSSPPSKTVPQPTSNGPDKAVDQTVNSRPSTPSAAPPIDPMPMVEFVVGSREKSGYLLYADPFQHSSTLPRIAAEPPIAAAPPVVPPPRPAAPVPSVASAASAPPLAPAPSIAPVSPVASASAVQPEPRPPIFERPRQPIFERPAPRLWSGELSPLSYDRKQKVAGHLPRVGLFIGFIAALIVLSLGAGWAAGRGAFDGFVHEIQTVAARGTAMVSNAAAPTTSTPSTPAPIEPAVPTPAPETSTNSQPAVIPPQASPNLAAPAPHQPANPGLEAPVRKPAPSWMQPSVSGPIRQRAAGTERERQAAPPEVESYSGPGNIILFPGDPSSVIPVPQVESRIGTLQRGGLVRRVNPVYPEAAKQQRVEGTVRLHVIVGVNGAIRSVDFVSGPKMLAAAAENAVARWLYAPSLLDGKPIEMEYEVSLAFQLPKSAY